MIKFRCVVRNLLFILIFYLSACGPWWGGTPHEIVVERGDTLYSLSKRYNIQMRDLIDANHLAPPYTLRIGQVLRVPSSNYHIVSRGDTLYSISKRYGVDVNTLAVNNDIYPPYTLIIGQRIAINSRGLSSSYSQAPKQPLTTSYAENQVKTKQNANTAPTIKKTAQPSTSVSKYRKTKFAWPVRGEIVSKYGTIGKGRANDGINIKAPKGTTVKAADAGTVAYAGNELKGFGNLILVRHSDGWITAYAHNDKLLVKKGQKVLKGEKIATVGTTGGVNTPQLHFEIRAGKNPVNPVSYLQ